MKGSRIQLLLLLLALTCLVALTGIQVSWVVSEARQQKEEFDNKVRQALTSLEQNTRRVKDCPLPNKNDGSCSMVLRSINEAFNLDSLIRNDLSRHGIDLEYEYGIVNVNLGNYRGPRKGKTVSANLAEGLKESGYELLIDFPRMHTFILAQMGNAFISSIVLIVLLFVSFLLIFRFYRREKEFSRQIKYFVNNMAHEFKTPLTNISFATSMVAKHEYVRNDEKLSSLTEIIKVEQAKLNERLGKVLSSFDRAEPEQRDTSIVNLVNIAEAVVSVYRDQVVERGGQINLTTHGQNFDCTCEEDSIHIVLSNLIDNAIKYSPDSPMITVVLKATEKSFSIEVADRGIGIPKSHQKRIFDQYYRVPAGDTHDAMGFGIGLFHVKQIAMQLDGSVKVISSPRSGSRFVIEWSREVVK